MKTTALSLIIFSLATGIFAVELPVASAAELPPINKVIDTAKTINQDIQNKLSTSPVTQEIVKELPTKEQASGFFAGVWRIIWAIVKFIAGIFDWALKVVVGLFSVVASKIGLGFFNQ